MLTGQDRASLRAVLGEGWASFVGLHLVDATGAKVFWEEHPQFGQVERDEKYWPLDKEDNAENSPLLRAIEAAAVEARDMGYWKLMVRFIGARPKEQADRYILLTDKKSAKGGSDSLELQSAKIQLETTTTLAKTLGAVLPTIERAYAGGAEELRQANRSLSAELERSRSELSELSKENRELRKRVRELEENGGIGGAAVLKLLEPGNLAGQAALITLLRGGLGALQAGSLKEALAKFGMEGLSGLDEMLKQTEQGQIGQQQPEAAP